MNKPYKLLYAYTVGQHYKSVNIINFARPMYEYKKYTI